MNLQINRDTNYVEQFSNKIEDPSSLTSWEMFQQSYQIAETVKIDSFTDLISLKLLPHLELLPHQKECAETVIQEMNGRALLADEVGLGKTIEAGIILKEYLVRGLVKKVLILVPASLVNQWTSELNQKFLIPANPASKRVNWEHSDIIISTLDTAKSERHRQVILEQDYDLVIVDEAHKLKNHKTKNFSFVQQLKKKYCLLLTATPIQNKLTDIYNLISILRPGYLGNYEDFMKNYRQQNKHVSDPYLKQLISKVMIRNRRKETGVTWTDRKIETVWVDFTQKEYQTYEAIEHFFKERTAISSLTYRRELCSSREACYLSLKKWGSADNFKNNDRELQQLLQSIGELPHHSKAMKLIDLIKGSNEKFIVFTEYRATQIYLQWLLHQENIPTVIFRGGFKKGKKDWMRQLFQNQARVMIATEAAGEGINLQFCHHLVNYDLPWNPMRLEQRIGRLHRFGQENDVHIYNFAIRNTIDEHVMNLLYSKIALFENVVGQLDEILSEIQVSNLEKEIESIFKESKSVGETKIKLDNLTAVISSHTTNTELGEKSI